MREGRGRGRGEGERERVRFHLSPIFFLILQKGLNEVMQKAIEVAQNPPKTKTKANKCILM